MYRVSNLSCKRIEKPQFSRGFTIVELLIVVVVIAILAAITIVSYNGIQARAVETSVRTDVNTIAKQLELFKAEQGRYPEVPSSTGVAASELEGVIKAAGLWSTTRANLEQSTTEVLVAPRSFVFCALPDLSRYYVISGAPILKGISSTALDQAVGKKLFYYSSESSSGETTFKHEIGVGNTAVNICNSVIPNYDHTAWRAHWSFDVPTLKAQ